MGSYRGAMMCGYLCRLCALYKDQVIHLYSNKAQELSLLEKIKILPIKIKKYDKLPKTICKSCLTKLISQYEYIQEFRRIPMPYTRSPLAHNGSASTSRLARSRTEQQRSSQSSSSEDQIPNPQSNIINEQPIS